MDHHFMRDLLSILKKNSIMLNKSVWIDIIAMNESILPEISEIVNDNEALLEIVKKNGYSLEYIANPSYDMCYEAVKQNKNAFIHVPYDKQTLELCFYAIKDYPLNMQYVMEENQTYDLCIFAINEYPKIIRYIKKQTLELCSLAIEKDPATLFYIDDEFKTREICLKAVQKDGLVLKFVKNQTFEICLEAVKQNGLAVKYVEGEYQTYEIYLAAINQCGDAIQHILTCEITDELHELAIRNDPKTIKWYGGSSIKLYVSALDLDSECVNVLGYSKMGDCLKEYVNEKKKLLTEIDQLKNYIKILEETVNLHPDGEAVKDLANEFYKLANKN